MVNDLRQAATAALEEMKRLARLANVDHKDSPAIVNLSAALAEQELEGGVCGRCGGLVFDPVLPQPRREPLTDAQKTKAALWDLAVSKGLVTVHSEQLAQGTWSAQLSVASWIEGHDKACDISNEAAHNIKEKNK